MEMPAACIQFVSRQQQRGMSAFPSHFVVFQTPLYFTWWGLREPSTFYCCQ